MSNIFLTILLTCNWLFTSNAQADTGSVTITVKSGKELRQVLKSKHEELIAHGGTILLKTGDYGIIEIKGLSPAKRISIVAAKEAKPQIAQLRLQDVRNIALDSLFVMATRPTLKHLGSRRTRSLIEVSGSKDVQLSNMRAASALNTLQWSKEDWKQKAINGIYIRSSSHVVVKNSLVENIDNGITDTRGADNLFESNTVKEFSGDGLRALSRNGVFKNNYVTGCIKIDENHDDGIQSWSFGPDGKPGKGELVGLRIIGNRIELGDASHPLRCPHLQGIGFFDGFWRDLLIEDNRITIDHWHGISVFGALDSTIRGNVVRYKRSPAPKREGTKKTWIKVGPHKDGRPSQRVVVENNQAASFNIKGEDMTTRNNKPF